MPNSISLAMLALWLLQGVTAQLPRAPAHYPPVDVRGPLPLPAWVATYERVKLAGLIPAVPVTTMRNGNPAYDAGVDMRQACSWTVGQCYNPYDVVDAPRGVFAVAFDDGPQPPSAALTDYLVSQNQTSTHFLIGSRVADYPVLLQRMVAAGSHVGVHTWSHPYLTTLTDMQILGEIGWTMQAIFDATGLVPAFFRPPYGDVDNRVRAIVREVFGLYVVIWNQDSFDWCLAPGGGSTCVGFGPKSDAELDTRMREFASMAQTPGLIPLEHESSDRSVAGFIRNYPNLKSNWRMLAFPDIWNVSWYQNAANNFAPKTPNVLIGGGSVVIPGAGNVSIPTTTIASQSSTIRVLTPTSEGVLVTAQPATSTAVLVVTAAPTTAPAPTTSAAPIPTRAAVNAGTSLQIGLAALWGIAGAAVLV